MLDLKMLIPEEISGTHIESEISRDQIRISGRYRNHRRFSLNLNRFIDEPLFYFGCGLFAGEGTKGGKGTPFEFANSNPMIIRKMMQLLRQLGIPKSTISPRVQLRVNEKSSRGLIETLSDFWSEHMEIPKDRFRKASIRVKETAGRSRYGTVSIRINSGIVGTLFIFWTDQILRDQYPLQS